MCVAEFVACQICVSKDISLHVCMFCSVCCNLLQCTLQCVLQCVVAYQISVQKDISPKSSLYYSVLQCIAVHCSVMQRAVWYAHQRSSWHFSKSTMFENTL